MVCLVIKKNHGVLKEIVKSPWFTHHKLKFYLKYSHKNFILTKRRELYSSFKIEKESFKKYTYSTIFLHEQRYITWCKTKKKQQHCNQNKGMDL